MRELTLAQQKIADEMIPEVGPGDVDAIAEFLERLDAHGYRVVKLGMPIHTKYPPGPSEGEWQYEHLYPIDEEL